ncbi:MAG: ABC transporter permease [Opitutaceae bacterium]|nr:ABC transporter permease [Cephaloticoccus sp.]MCP5529771.1 ABC transporter permease [Opitutaceae bacterium]
MHPIVVLFRKDFTSFFRSKASMALTFVVPFVLIYLFGQIFGINRSDSGPTGIPLAVVNASDNPAAARMVEALKAESSFRVITEFTNPDKSTRPLTTDDLRPLMEATSPRFRFALVIPADLVRADEIGLRLQILSNPRNEIETQTVNGILQKVIFSNVPELLGQSMQASARRFLGQTGLQTFNQRVAGAVADSFGGDPAEIEREISSGNFALRRLDTADEPAAAGATHAAPDFFSQLVKIDTEQVVGANVKSPAATRIVGGWAMQFLLFALSASATSLFRERDAGLFQRLLASPATRAHILWSKFLYGVCIGLIQLVVLFMAGQILFGIAVIDHLFLLVIVSIFAAASCTAFGMLLAAIAPNAEAASSLATFLILVMSAIGGAWFPISLLPEFIQQFSKLTLVYWAMEGFSSVLWSGHSLVQILPIVGILSLITATVMGVTIWRFNRGRLFD